MVGLVMRRCGNNLTIVFLGSDLASYELTYSEEQ